MAVKIIMNGEAIQGTVYLKLLPVIKFGVRKLFFIGHIV